MIPDTVLYPCTHPSSIEYESSSLLPQGETTEQIQLCQFTHPIQLPALPTTTHTQDPDDDDDDGQAFQVLLEALASDVNSN